MPAMAPRATKTGSGILRHSSRPRERAAMAAVGMSVMVCRDSTMTAPAMAPAAAAGGPPAQGVGGGGGAGGGIMSRAAGMNGTGVSAPDTAVTRARTALMTHSRVSRRLASRASFQAAMAMMAITAGAMP